MKEQTKVAKFEQVLDWPNRKPTVGDVIGSWCAYVLEMAADMSNFTSEVVGEFGYHDYIGALFARNFVEEAINEVSITKDDVEYYLIRTADEYFISLTRDDPGKVVIASEPDFAKYELNDKYWWLRRIPNGGALGYEVSRVARAQADLKY